MRTSLRLALFSSIVATATCKDAGPRATEPREFEAMLSNPVRGSSAVSGANSMAPAGQGMVYVSLIPGTIPDGRSIEIRHRGTGAVRRADLIDGGLDPVSVQAAVGDTLDLTATAANGAPLRTTQQVIAARRPTIVRTAPPRNKTDVPLNTVITIVFTEPIDSSSVTASSVYLLSGGTEVVGQLTFATPDHLVLNFRPAAPLAPQAAFTLVVTTEVKDLSGDRLEEPIVIPFVTQSRPVVPTGNVRVQVQTTGIGQDRDGYAVFLDSEYQEVNPTGVAYFAGVPEGTHILRIEGNAPNCPVPENPRPISVTAPQTTLLTLVIECTATHGLHISALTTGTDPDTNGFRVRVKRSGFDETVAVPANGVSALYGIVFGNVTLTLTDLGGNCTVTGANPRTVAVPDGGVAATTFDVACTSSGLIAFAAMAPDNNVDIRVVRPSGRGNTRLTTHPGRDVEPTWSPDGSRIAFRSDRDGNDEIYLMDADGSNVVRRTTHAARDYDPAWSPDGSKIAFVSERDGNAEIYVMNPDGGNVVRITNNSARDEHPDWSPDSRKIVFRSERHGNGEIYVMNADGTDAARLTTDGADDTDPAWSPDGNTIVFSRLVVCAPDTGEEVPCRSSPVLVAPNGLNETSLVVATPWLAEGWIMGDADWRNAAWSPDGRKIAFAVTFCGWDGDCHLSQGIWIVDRATGTATEFVNGSGSAAWRR